MKKRNSGKSVTEKHLFHGTDKSLVEAICDQNFDWRMCGVHGTHYGKGTVNNFVMLPLTRLTTCFSAVCTLLCFFLTISAPYLTLPAFVVAMTKKFYVLLPFINKFTKL